MPFKESQTEKLYYSISEVAALFNVNASLIRFWEKEFELIQPKKNKKGNRLFTKTDIENLQKIYDLVKEQGHTLDGAKQKLKKRFAKVGQNDEIYRKLVIIRTNLNDIYNKL